MNKTVEGHLKKPRMLRLDCKPDKFNFSSDSAAGSTNSATLHTINSSFDESNLYRRQSL